MEKTEGATRGKPTSAMKKADLTGKKQSEEETKHKGTCRVRPFVCKRNEDREERRLFVCIYL